MITVQRLLRVFFIHSSLTSFFCTLPDDQLLGEFMTFCANLALFICFCSRLFFSEQMTDRFSESLMTSVYLPHAENGLLAPFSSRSRAPFCRASNWARACAIGFQRAL